MRQKLCGIYEDVNGYWCINWYENDNYKEFRQESCKTKEMALTKAKELGFIKAMLKPGDARGVGRIEITL